MRFDKSRLSASISTGLYKRLCADRDKFGVSLSHIVSTALLEYYERRADNMSHVKGRSDTAGAPFSE